MINEMLFEDTSMLLSTFQNVSDWNDVCVCCFERKQFPYEKKRPVYVLSRSSSRRVIKENPLTLSVLCIEVFCR